MAAPLVQPLLQPWLILLINFLEEDRLRQAGMPEIDQMTGREFERWLRNFFQQKGYRVELTPGQGDWGADLILNGPRGRTAVQAKRWQGNVGVSAIQEVVAAKAHYDCDHALVVTNSRYTEAARKLAKSNQVELWDRDKLVAEILSLSNQKTLAKAK